MFTRSIHKSNQPQKRIYRVYFLYSCKFFSEHINYEVIGIKLRDAIIKHIENEKSNGRNITSSLDKRITIIE